MTKILSYALLVMPIALSSCASGDTVSDSNKAQSDITSTDVLFSIKKAERNYITEGSDKTGSNESERMYSVVSADIQWPLKIGSYDISVLQDSLQALTLGTTKGTIEQAISTSLSNPVGHDLYTLIPTDSIPIGKDAVVLYQKTQSTVEAFNERYIVFKVTHSAYQGGAHGMIATSYITWMLGDNTALNLQKAFKPDSTVKLRDALINQLMVEQNVKNTKALEDEGFFVDNLSVTPNFYIQGYNIVFHYNPYEIAAYSHGSIDIAIPYYQIADVLTPYMLHQFEAN